MEFKITLSGNTIGIEQGKFKARASLSWGNQLKNPISENGKPVMPERITKIVYDDVKGVYEMTVEYKNGTTQTFGGADLRVFPATEGMQVVGDDDGLVEFKL